MYSTLNLYGQSRTAVNKHYPCPSMALPTYHVDLPSLPKPPLSASKLSFAVLPTKVVEIDVPELKRTPLDLPKGKTTLLPVMDPRFNLREICKQCVLLEDHLTHEEKRCTDCCTKHFLTMEALAEEALTLDKEGILKAEIHLLPKKIRELEMLWIKNPSKCTEISQKLREIRKQFQESTFQVIENGCDNSACTVKL